MEQKDQPFETKGHSLTGKASLEFLDKEGFQVFAAKMAEYNPDRFEPVALKVYASFGSWIVTLYALDKNRQELGSDVEKLPVHKFKMEMDSPTFLNAIRSFDLVVSDGAFDIADIAVINK